MFPKERHRNAAILSSEIRSYTGSYFCGIPGVFDRPNLEKKLKAAGSDISSKEAWKILRKVRVVEIDLGNGERRRSVTHGSGLAAQILKILKINNLDPDGASKGEIRRHSDTRENPILCFQQFSGTKRNHGLVDPTCCKGKA